MHIRPTHIHEQSTIELVPISTVQVDHCASNRGVRLPLVLLIEQPVGRTHAVQTNCYETLQKSLLPPLAHVGMSGLTPNH